MSKIVKYPISYLSNVVDGFEDLLKKDLILSILDKNNCYIAGGFIRNLIRCGDISCISKYFQGGGDLDVFFYDKISFNKYFCKLGQINYYTPSLGSHAFNFNLYYEPIRRGVQVQLIKTFTGSPENILSTFDFTNCRVAFDLNHVWIDESLITLEKLKQLKIANQSATLTHRVAKYIKRYDYTNVEESSLLHLKSWFQSMLEHIKSSRIDLSACINPYLRILLQNNTNIDQAIDDKTLELLIKMIVSRRQTVVMRHSYDINPMNVSLTSEINLAQIVQNIRKLNNVQLDAGDLVEIPATIYEGINVNIAILIKNRNGNMWDVYLPQIMKTGTLLQTNIKNLLSKNELSVENIAKQQKTKWQNLNI